MVTNGEVFTEVRQRVAAYFMHCKRYGMKCPDLDTLDDIYRFLYGSFDLDSLRFYTHADDYTNEEDFIRCACTSKNTQEKLKELLKNGHTKNAQTDRKRKGDRAHRKA